MLTARPRSLSGWSFPHVGQQCSKLHRVQKAPPRLGPILSPSPISRTVFVDVKHRERKGTVPLVPLESGFPTGSSSGVGAISKHWFTTSFLQPLPYLVTP